MKQMITKLALTAMLAIPVPSFAEENEGRRLAELAFSNVAGSEYRKIDMGEFSNFGNDVFVSMDSDENKKLSLEEFMGWGFGMSNVAEERDRVEAYEAALRILFAIRDRNGNGEISMVENRKSINLDFQRADLDGDALITQDEFLKGYMVMIAFRAALNTNLK